MYRGGGVRGCGAAMALLTVTVLCSCVGGVGAALGDAGESTAMAAHHHRGTAGSGSGEDAAAGPASAARRSLLAMGINDVEAAVSRLFEAKRDALEYANKNRAAADVVPETAPEDGRASGGDGDGDGESGNDDSSSSSSSSSSGASVSTASLLPTPANAATEPPTFGACGSKADCRGDRMMCVDGQCRCPVLFPGGENCDEPREPTIPWCLTPLPTWPKVGPKYMKSKKEPHDFSTCAVVGNAATMKGSGVGDQISAHTAVFRFNEAPYKGMEKDVGDKTTLRFQNRDRSGFAEVKGEICVVREGKWYKGQNSKGKCRMEQMPEEVEKKLVDGHWKVHRQGAPADPGRPWMSNGFSGITFALHMCARVDVYGFTFGTGYYFKKYAGLAKDWGRKGGTLRPPSKSLESRHPWVKERACLQQLADELPQQLVVHTSADPKNAKPGGKNVKLAPSSGGGGGGSASKKKQVESQFF